MSDANTPAAPGAPDAVLVGAVSIDFNDPMRAGASTMGAFLTQVAEKMEPRLAGPDDLPKFYCGAASSFAGFLAASFGRDVAHHVLQQVTDLVLVADFPDEQPTTH